MIKLITRFVGFKDFYLLYQLLKQKEFTINMGSMGVRFEQKKGVVEISIVALGKDYGKQVYLTKENIIKKEKVIIEKKIKPKKKITVEHNDDSVVQEEDLFQ